LSIPDPKNSTMVLLVLLGRISCVLMSSTFMNTIMPPLAGAVSDHLNTIIGRRHPLMMLGALVGAFCSMCMAFFIFPLRYGFFESTFFGLVCFAVCQGASLSMAQGAFQGLIPDLIEDEKMGLTAGIMGLVRSLGNLIGVVLTGALVEFVPYPWNFISTYFILSCVILYCYLYSFVALEENPPPVRKPFSCREFVLAFWLPPKKYCNFYFVFLSRACFELGTFGIVSFIQYYLADVYNDPLTGAVVGSNIILIMFHGDLWMVYLACGFIGIGIGSFYAVDLALGIDTLPDKENIAKDMGIWTISSVIPAMCAPFLTGLVLDTAKRFTSLRAAWAMAFGLSGFWYVLSGIFILPIRVIKKDLVPTTTSEVKAAPKVEELNSQVTDDPRTETDLTTDMNFDLTEDLKSI
jgi:MFS family permease